MESTLQAVRRAEPTPRTRRVRGTAATARFSRRSGPVRNAGTWRGGHTASPPRHAARGDRARTRRIRGRPGCGTRLEATTSGRRRGPAARAAQPKRRLLMRERTVLLLLAIAGLGALTGYALWEHGLV